MTLCSGHRHTSPGQRRAAPPQGLPCRLRAAARALRHWWEVERHYRPERRYMRG